MKGWGFICVCLTLMGLTIYLASEAIGRQDAPSAIALSIGSTLWAITALVAIRRLP